MLHVTPASFLPFPVLLLRTCQFELPMHSFASLIVFASLQHGKVQISLRHP